MAKLLLNHSQIDESVYDFRSFDRVPDRVQFRTHGSELLANRPVARLCSRLGGSNPDALVERRVDRGLARIAKPAPPTASTSCA